MNYKYKAKIKMKTIVLIGLLLFPVGAIPVTAYENNSSNRNTIDLISSLFKLLPDINSTTIDKTTQMINVIRDNPLPINNTTVESATTTIRAIQKFAMNNTTIDQAAKVITAINNISINDSTAEKITNVIQAFQNIKRRDK